MSIFKTAFQLYRAHRLFWQLSLALAALYSMIAMVAVLPVEMSARARLLLIQFANVVPLIIHGLLIHAAYQAWNGQTPRLRPALNTLNKQTERMGRVMSAVLVWWFVLFLVVSLSSMWYFKSGAVDEATYVNMLYLLMIVIALPVNLFLQFAARAILIDGLVGLSAFRTGIKVTSRCMLPGLAISAVWLGAMYLTQTAATLLILSVRSPAEFKAFAEIGIGGIINAITLSPTAQIASTFTQPVFVPFYVILMSVMYLKVTRPAPMEPEL